MQTSDLKNLAEWLAATDIDLLELRSPGGHLVLRRGLDAGAAPRSPATGALTPQVPPPAAQEPTATVKATSVGTFLACQPGGELTLAPPGAAVRAGQLLGLLQVGALLLPVRAPAAGLVIRPLAIHGSLVGYGTALFEIAPLTTATAEEGS